VSRGPASRGKLNAELGGENTSEPGRLAPNE
jgi:hypothetical protein